MEKINSFKIIGIAVTTSNQNGENAKDIGNLWQQFFALNLPEIITNKISDDIYSIYTDYESDFTGKYTTLLGFKVDSLLNVPSGLTAREFEGENFIKFTAKGSMPNAVVETWEKIWADKKLNRKYSYDFEVYGKKSQDGENSEVEIFVAIK